MKREPWVLAFALVFPTVMAWIYFVSASPGATVDGPSPLVRWLYILGKIVQFGLPVTWIFIVDRRQLRFTPLTTRGIRISVAFGLAVGAVAISLYWMLEANTSVFHGVADRIRAKLAEFGAGDPQLYAMLAGFLAIINSGMEEYYWRWFVYGRLRNHLSILNANRISSLGFMAHHVIVLSVYFPGHFWSAVVPFSLAIAFGGAMWAWVYQQTASLVGPWISHFIVDVAVMAIGYDLVFRQ